MIIPFHVAPEVSLISETSLESISIASLPIFGLGSVCFFLAVLHQKSRFWLHSGPK